LQQIEVLYPNKGKQHCVKRTWK